MSQLFRQEAVDQRRQRLFGAVVIRPERGANLYVGAVTAVAIVAIGVAASARYARTETVPGAVVTSAPAVKVLTPRGGRIDKLHVVEGQEVRAGEPLIEVSADLPDLGGVESQASALASMERQASLAAEQLSLQRKAGADEAARLDQTIATAEEELRALSSQIAVQAQIVETARSAYERLGPIVAQGYVSRIEYDRRRQASLVEQQRAVELQRQQTQIRGRLLDLQAQRRRVFVESRRRLIELASAAAGIDRDRASARGQQGYVVTAPVSGTTTAIGIAPGRIADPNVAAMVIIPDNSRFEAELYVPSKAIGFIRPGQPVRIMYDAFSYRRFGSFGGRIVRVARSITKPRDLDAPLNLEDAVYVVRARLDAQSVAAFGKAYALQPGMTLRASIVLDRQNIFEWLAEPITAVRARG